MNYKYTLIGLTILMVSSCSQEKEISPDNALQEVRVTAGIATSRIALSNRGDYTYTLWHNNDKISLFTSSQSNLVYAATTKQDSVHADFTATSEKLNYIEGNTVYACYPETTVAADNGMVVNLPSTQNFDYNNGVIRSFGYAVSNISKGSVNFTFKHISAFLCLTLSPNILTTASTNVIDKIMVSTSSAIPLSVGDKDTFDFSTLTANTTSGSNIVQMNVDSLTLSKDWQIFIPILPQPADATLTITLVGVDGSTLYTLSKQAPSSGFLAGNVYKANVNNSGTTTTEEFGAVDLGLSVKWANFNLGASSPEDYGDYYAFGEVAPKSQYEESNWINPRTLYLSGSNDAATYQLGNEWRMPTKAEATELLTECIWELTNIGDIIGYRVTGKTGNSIFLPLTGSWDADPTERWENYEARYRVSEGFFEEGETLDDFTTVVLELQKNFADTEVDSDAGWSGHPIRPVQPATTSESQKQLLGAHFKYESYEEIYTITYNTNGNIDSLNCTVIEPKYGTEQRMYLEHSDDGKSIKATFTEGETYGAEWDYIANISINDMGYIESFQQNFGDGTSETWLYEYNSTGTLNSMKRDYIAYTLEYDSNDNAIQVVSFEESINTIHTDSITYGNVENKSNIVLHEMMNGIDIDEMEPWGLVGLLGKPSKYLPIQRKRVNNDEFNLTYDFEWTIDEEGYPTQLFVKENGSDFCTVTFNWFTNSR